MGWRVLPQRCLKFGWMTQKLHDGCSCQSLKEKRGGKADSRLKFLFLFVVTCYTGCRIQKDYGEPLLIPVASTGLVRPTVRFAARQLARSPSAITRIRKASIKGVHTLSHRSTHAEFLPERTLIFCATTVSFPSAPANKYHGRIIDSELEERPDGHRNWPCWLELPLFANIVGVAKERAVSAHYVWDRTRTQRKNTGKKWIRRSKTNRAGLDKGDVSLNKSVLRWMCMEKCTLVPTTRN